MKIELKCSTCDAVLRVGAEHAGKQLRCPNCQNLTRIPLASEPQLETSNGDENSASQYQAPMQDWHQPTPAYINPPMPSQSSNEVISLVFGILGVLLNIGCGCLFPIWFILNCYGLYLAITSNGSLRTAGIIANSIALCISGFWGVMSLTSL